MNSEERNITYQITGCQLDTIVEVIDTLTLVYHALRMPDEMPVTREVVGSAVSVAQDALDRFYDHIKEFPKVRPEQSELQAIAEDREVPASARIQAARTLLEYGIKLTEINDLQFRLEVLEQNMEDEK